MGGYEGSLRGQCTEISSADSRFPAALTRVRCPPEKLYVLGDPSALQEGLAIVGARKATPYGLSAARHFGGMAARYGLAIISGGARGCDSEAHMAALENDAPTVVFLGSGCNYVYPAENAALFQRIIDGGGAIVSEHPWDAEPRPYFFRERNRLIAGLAKATLIVEAGLPSGTFSTADEAIEAAREVIVVPGAITSDKSHGANRLIYQGATPIIDDETFMDQLNVIFGDSAAKTNSRKKAASSPCDMSSIDDFLLDALQAEQLTLDELVGLVDGKLEAENALSWLMVWLARMQAARLIAKFPNGRYGPIVD